MSLAIGNILKITANQSFGGQLTQNVFFYRQTALPTPVDGQTSYKTILERFNAVWGIVVRAKQNTGCVHTFYRVDNLSNGIDFEELAINVPGTEAADPEPSFTALNFVLRRSTGLTRNGSKRMGGLSETSVSGNNITWDSATRTAVEGAFGSKLLSADSTPVPLADPVIVGRLKVTDSAGKVTYVLDISKINPIASAAYTAVSTQRSRKVGKGI